MTSRAALQQSEQEMRLMMKAEGLVERKGV